MDRWACVNLPEPAGVKKEVAVLTERLRRFTPEVEPSSAVPAGRQEEPGVFWLNAAGLDRLYPSLKEWAHSIRSDLRKAGFNATVVVGFTRFGTCAVAKSQQGIVVFDDPSLEREAALQAPLDRLNLNPDLLDTLLKLGVETVGAFLSLPPGGLLERFGPDAYRLHRMASGDLWAPIQPHPIEEPISQALALDDPETDAARLLFLIKRLLHPLLATLAARGEALAELRLRLFLEGFGWREERIRPAAPTLDAVQIIDLVRLRLESLALPAGVAEIELTAHSTPASLEQLQLFAAAPRRDLDAGARALARLRAEFGDDAVVKARLADGHLPEARFVWEPVDRVALPLPREGAERCLVRRLFSRPVEREPKPVTRLHGPFIISGGWWEREAHREYSFAETRRGDLLWVYYDRLCRRWFLHGWVE